ncbi:hypothetical protein PtrV1_06239 [Pyrenophora tritici-repentis]|nr:hypothetical protein PtrV1_06239 [Pyrenophora tritici-repentis]PZD01362.1 hypothetical protein A1F95_02447 [Pyrenophora tritici-repentis]
MENFAIRAYLGTRYCMEPNLVAFSTGSRLLIFTVPVATTTSISQRINPSSATPQQGTPERASRSKDRAINLH